MATPNQKLLLTPVRATISALDLSEATVREAINAAVAKQQNIKSITSALAPITSDGKPMMLQISAWIVHAPKPNENNQGFRSDDLMRIAQAGLFQAPYFGMIDLDHDWTPRGVWYSAEWAYDAQADSWGLLAKGAIWAWKFPEIAEYLMKRQSVVGYVDVSMGALYLHSEPKVWEDGRQYEEIHDPVFVATSVLTKQPADPAAQGLVVLDGGTETNDILTQILKASADAGVSPEDEEINMDELMKKIEALLGEQKAELQPLIDAVAKLAKAESDLAEAATARETAEGQVAELTATVATLTSEKTELTATIATLSGEKGTAEAALEGAQTTIASLNEQVETLTAFKAEIDAKVAEAAKAEKLAARKAEIPEVVMASMDLEKDDDKSLFEGWMAQTDEQWDATKRVLALASNRKSHAERSEAEGNLSGASDKGDNKFAINRWKRRA